MSRAPIPSSFFVFSVVMHEGRFLVIRERKEGRGWYAPAGRLERGETVQEAAVRETQEEAGIAIVPTALLRIDQEWLPPRDGSGVLRSWWRFILRAIPAPGTDLTPKRFADEHSLEARWLTLSEIEKLPLRHTEVLDIFSLAVTLSQAPAM